MNIVWYSLVRWVPNPLRGEFVNVGLLAWDDQRKNDFDGRHSAFKRAAALGEVPDDLPEWVDRMMLPVFEASPEDRKALVERLVETNRNLLQVSYPFPTSYPDSATAVRDLYPVLVGDET